MYNNEQLLDEVEQGIQNFPTGVNVICRSRKLRQITLTEAWIIQILDTLRKPNPIIVLLFILLK